MSRGDANEPPPPRGIVGYVVVAPGHPTELFAVRDEEKANAYAARHSGTVWPLVCAKRASDFDLKFWR